MKLLFLIFLTWSVLPPLWAQDDSVEKPPMVNCRRINIDQVIHFDSGQSRIREPSFPILNDVASVILANPSIAVQVRGFTDSHEVIGKEKNIGEKRAREIIYYLISKGVSPESLSFTGEGSGFPVASDTTPEGRAKNRRAEFKTFDRLDEKNKYIPSRKNNPKNEEDSQELAPTVKCSSAKK